MSRLLAPLSGPGTWTLMRWKQVVVAAEAGYVQLDAELENTTCHEADTVRIKCDITGYPLPSYRWYKDGVVIDTSSTAARARFDADRFNIKTTPWGSR